MKIRVLVLMMVLLAAAPMRAGDRLALSVSPSMAFEPADVTIRAMIAHSPENRSVEIIAESSDFYRSSIVPLDGESAPKMTMVSYRSLPSGDYTVRVIVRGSRGQQLGWVERVARIVDRDGEP